MPVSFYPVEGETVPPTVFAEYPLLQKAAEGYVGTSHSLEQQLMLSLPPSVPTLGFTTG